MKVGRGRKQLMAGALCLAVLLTDVGPMSLRVAASEAEQGNSALGDVGNVAINAGNNAEEEEKKEDGSSVLTDDGSRSDSVEKDTNVEDGGSQANGEEETEGGDNLTEDSSIGGNDENLSEGNGGVDGGSGSTEGSKGADSGNDMSESGDNIDDEPEFVEGNDKEQGENGAETGASVPEETENVKYESEGGTDVEESGEDAVEGTVSENTVVISEEVVEENAETTTLSGKCGASLWWVLEDGTLTINGTGKMWEYVLSPWQNYSISNLIIEEGVTSIDENAFAYQYNLVSIRIPKSMMEIGYGAFSGCSALKEVHISSLESWCNISFDVPVNDWSYAFANPLCYAKDLYINGILAKKIIISDNISTIKDCVFYGCNVENIEISPGVASIGIGAFAECKNLKSVKISSSVTSIGNGAFDGCSSLDNVEIPSSVTNIGSNAFRDCNNLNIVKIPSSVTNIGNGAFRGCSSLNNVEIPSSVTNIGSDAFRDCCNLKSVKIPSNVTNLSSGVFGDCSGLNSVEIPSCVTTIGRYAFEGCSSLNSVEIPSSIISIEEGAFWECTGLKEVHTSNLVNWCNISFEVDMLNNVGATANPLTYAHNLLVNEKLMNKIVIPNDVTVVKSGAFAGCNMESVEIPSSVTSIGIGAFSSCYNLISVEIPQYVASIENYAFSNCSKLNSIKIPSCVTAIGDYAFSRCQVLNSLEIPSSVESIGRGVCSDCYRLSNVELSSRVTMIGDYAFSNCYMLKSLEVPTNVTSIGHNAFAACRDLKKVDIPLNVTSIGKDAFSKCKLEEIRFLNPYCSIYDSESTISDDFFYTPLSEVKIYGYANSTAQFYAEKYNKIFVVMEGGMNGDSTAPGIWFSLEANPKKIIYKDGYNCSQFDMNVTVMCMLPSIEAPTYDNVTAKIELSDGLSYAENAVNRSYTKNLGTMNFDTVQKQNISVPVYIDQSNITSEFQVTVSVTADGYDSAQTKTFSIPVDLPVDRAESIVDAVERYTALDEIREVTAIMESSESYDEMMEKLFEYYNYDNMTDVADRISTLSATHRESWDYNTLIQNEIFLSYQFYNYLNNTPNGVLARACLYGSGLVFNGEIMDWIDLSTYLDGDYPGVEKYKSMLEEFIEKESTQLEYYSTLQTTQSFINDSVGLCSKIEKGEVLKELGKQKNVVGVHSVFNDFCKAKIKGLDGKDVVFNYEKTTPFMEAMDMVGTSFKMTNMTIDGIMDFVDVSANLEIYESYHNFLQEIYEADDLPWELVAAAYKLDEEMKDAYWTPVKNILNTIRDECFDKALNLEKFSAVVEANSYLSVINYTAFVINQFVDVGKLVVNSCHTEGYAFLQMHYRNKLVQYKNEFVADKTPENAWKFYEAYVMLWKLRAAGEEKYLEMNRLEGGKAVDNLSQWATGGTLSGLLSDMCGYKDLQEATKQNLELLDKIAFKFNEKDIPEELMYLRKTVMECPVNVELISPDGTLIASLNDNEEISLSNDYGKFVSFYRATTGDYVKIAYFNNAEPITVKAIGTENGKVSYTYVETQNHETYDVSGFNNVLVRPGSSIQIKTDQKTYAIDQDADGIVDIEGEQADKKRIFVQFDYQDGRTIKIVYADQDGNIVLPDISLSDKRDFSGWYTEPEGAGEEFTAETIVKTSRTVYAKWGEVEKFYTVTFDANNHGDIPAPYTNLAEGAKIEEPPAPVAAGYTFTGWYKEQSCENKWDFAVDTVQEDITLYAGWTENGAEKLYRVSFDTLNHGIAPEAYTDVKENSRIPEPKAPTADGYRFTGWFKDNKCTVRWRFGTDTVTSDITLYAGWVLDDDYGDILDEDIPASGIIPAGLWIAEVSDYLYTGKAIKPEVHVYDGKIRLIKGRDYTITYKNNIKAGDDATSSKAPTIIVKGKGNYAGTETETFTIQRVNLDDSEIACDNLTAAYTSKVQKKLPSISYRGKKLSRNKDFTVSYPDLSRGITEAYCAPGTYDILLTAKGGGNYAGTRTVKLTITKSILLSKASVKKIPDQPYTGKEVEPELTVTLQKTPLIKNTDYTVAYINNKEAGKATAVLSGIGDYAGTKKVTFNIKGISLKKAKVDKISTQTYNGSEQEPNVSLSVGGIPLKNGTDYQITYTNNLNAGTGTATIKGINAYTGSIKKTFRIDAYNLKEDTANRIGGLRDAITCKYLKGGSKPEIELTYAGKKLTEGIDYTLSYKNNKALTTAGTGKLPTVTITGKGNFKGSISKNFTIVGKALDDKEFPVTLRAADKGFKDGPRNYISRPVLVDTDGTKLIMGKDYDKNIIYMRENGTLLDQTDKLIIGEKVKVKVTGRGAYSGELEAVYEMKPDDFSKAKITIASKPYTGSNITLDKDDITVKLNGSNLRFGTDYEIIDGSYINNIKRGTAEVTIAGKGEYGGMKTVKFRIVSKKFQWFWRLLK